MDPSFGSFGQTNSSQAFGSSSLFGVPSTQHEMNVYYLQQAQQYLISNPSTQAQAQVQYWLSIVQAGQAQQQHQMAGTAHVGTAGQNMNVQAAQAAANAPAYVASASAGAPSQLFGGQQGSVFHHGSMEQRGSHMGSASAGNSAFHTPAASRPPTPRPRHRRDTSQQPDRRGRHRTRSQGREDGDDDEDDRDVPRGLGTRIISAESHLRRHAEALAQLGQFKDAFQGEVEGVKGNLKVYERNIEARLLAIEQALNELKSAPSAQKTDYFGIGSPLSNPGQATVPNVQQVPSATAAPGPSIQGGRVVRPVPPG